MDSIINALLILLTGSISTGGLLFLLVLLNPEKVQIWASMIWKLLDKCRFVFRSAHKQYVKYDIQGRINNFIVKISTDAPYLLSNKVKLEWVNSNEINRNSFLQNDEVIIHLRREDPEDQNFIHGAYLFVSTSLLYKSKRYISQGQRQAIDLFVTTKIIEKEKPAILEYYLEEYLHKALDKKESKLMETYDHYTKIDIGGLFYPVLLQELEFLGEKVFGKRKDESIFSEINEFIGYLENVALKPIGVNADLVFSRAYCKMAIVIVGKAEKITTDGETYVSYIQKYLIPNKIETIYLLGKNENMPIIERVAESMKNYSKYRSTTKQVTLKGRNGDVIINQYIVVMRLNGITVFQTS
jgi:hypothetical protein